MPYLPEVAASDWWVYMVLTTSGKLYTGISTDIDRRFQEHCDTSQGKGNKGAKFFRSDTPVAVVYREACSDRSAASRREAAIKQLTSRQKRQLIQP
jgi:putative endonuclease